MPTNSSILDHLLKNVLEFSDTEVGKLHQLKYHKIGRLKNIKLSTIDEEKSSKDMSSVMYKQLKRWMWYYKVHQPSLEDIANLDDSLFDDIDLDELEHQFQQLSFKPPTSLASTTSSSTTTTPPSTLSYKHAITKLPAASTKADDIQGLTFLKYAEIKLRDKDDILIFYRDIYNQGKQYNIHITKLEDITNIPKATVPSDLTDFNAIQVTADILYQKFRKSDVIVDTYETAHHLLDTTTDGYEFLLLLLRQAHTKLLIKPSATADIPRFTTYKCIYKYARAIKEYERHHNLASRRFTDHELCTMFLAHLDHHCFNTINASITSIIRTSATIPAEYLVPAIAATIDQSITIPTFATYPTPKIHQLYDNQYHPQTPLIEYPYEVNPTSPHNSIINNIADSNFVPYVNATDFQNKQYSDEINYLNTQPRIQNPYIQKRLPRSNIPFPPNIPKRPPQPPYPRGRQVQPPNNQLGPYAPTFNTPPGNSGFRGRCKICGVRYHHEGNCLFLLKVKQALAYLALDPNSPQTKRSQFQLANKYDKAASTIRSLQDANFIPYEAPTDALLELADDDVFEPEDLLQDDNQ